MTDLTIVGAGLIGCSFARAARSCDLFERIVAVEPSPRHAQRALELGYVDGVADEVISAQPVMIACPSDQTILWIERLQDHDASVFDVASVKGAIISRLRESLGAAPANYVPCHPIAGRERSGPDAATADLFSGRPLIITPTAELAPARRAEVVGWWQAIGARVVELDPLEHDRVYARTSHLPHLLAFAYLRGIEASDLAHSGGGFRDFSRIGASDPDMWSAIFDLNREALLEALAGYQQHLDELSRAVRDGDLDHCRALLTDARLRRGRLIDD